MGEKERIQTETRQLLALDWSVSSSDAWLPVLESSDMYCSGARPLSRRIFSSLLSVFVLMTYASLSMAQNVKRPPTEDYCFFLAGTKCQILARDFVAFDIIPTKELMSALTEHGPNAYVYFFDINKKDQQNRYWDETIEFIYKMANWYFDRHKETRCLMLYNSGQTLLLDKPDGFNEIVAFIDNNPNNCKIFEVIITKEKVK